MSSSEKRHMSKSYEEKRYTKDYTEYRAGTHCISVVGSLKSHSKFYSENNAPNYIQQIVNQGYNIPLTSHVPNLFRRNNRSSRDCPEFVQQAIDDLLDTGAVVELSKPARVNNPLTVSQKSKKLRLVLDLRHVNLRTKSTSAKLKGQQHLTDT